MGKGGIRCALCGHLLMYEGGPLCNWKAYVREATKIDVKLCCEEDHNCYVKWSNGERNPQEQSRK